LTIFSRRQTNKRTNERTNDNDNDERRTTNDNDNDERRTTNDERRTTTTTTTTTTTNEWGDLKAGGWWKDCVVGVCRRASWLAVVYADWF